MLKQNLNFLYFPFCCLLFHLRKHLAEAKGRGGFAGYGSSRGYGYSQGYGYGSSSDTYDDSPSALYWILGIFGGLFVYCCGPAICRYLCESFCGICDQLHDSGNSRYKPDEEFSSPFIYSTKEEDIKASIAQHEWKPPPVYPTKDADKDIEQNVQTGEEQKENLIATPRNTMNYYYNGEVEIVNEKTRQEERIKEAALCLEGNYR